MKFLLFILAAFCISESALTIPAEQATQALLSQKLGKNREFNQRSIRRLGNRTIELEIFIATEADLSIASEVFSNHVRYNDWALKNFNYHADGRPYFIWVHSLDPEKAFKNRLRAHFEFLLPLFKKKMERNFEITIEKRPDYFGLEAVSIPVESPFVKHIGAMIRIYRSTFDPSILWVYVRGETVFNSWVLYEALPEKLVARESGERIQTLIDNYLHEEKRIRSSRIPTEKTEAGVEVTPPRSPR